MPQFLKLGILALATLSSVKGYGALVEPRACFRNQDEILAPDAIIEAEEDDATNWRNASVFYYKIQELGYPDLQTYFQKKNVEDCKNTPINGPPVDTSNMQYLQWGLLNGKEAALDESDTGPCEVWIDNTRVRHYWDCAGVNHYQLPILFDIDFSVCRKEQCILRVYWLSMDLHNSIWRLQNQCAPISNTISPGTVNPPSDIPANSADTSIDIPLPSESVSSPSSSVIPSAYVPSISPDIESPTESIPTTSALISSHPQNTKQTLHQFGQSMLRATVG